MLERWCFLGRLLTCDDCSTVFSCISRVPCHRRVCGRLFGCFLVSRTPLSALRWDLPLWPCCRELEKQNVFPAGLLKLSFVCVFSAARVPRHLVPLVSLFLALRNLTFSSFISLFLFFRPPRSSRTSLRPSARSTPAAPSQDKQPLC